MAVYQAFIFDTGCTYTLNFREICWFWRKAKRSLYHFTKRWWCSCSSQHRTSSWMKFLFIGLTSGEMPKNTLKNASSDVFRTSTVLKTATTKQTRIIVSLPFEKSILRQYSQCSQSSYLLISYLSIYWELDIHFVSSIDPNQITKRWLIHS